MLFSLQIQKLQKPSSAIRSAVNIGPSEFHTNSLRTGSLEWRMEKAIEESNANLAEKISDFLVDRQASKMEEGILSHASHESGKNRPKRPIWV
ncbi:hypothetical protein FGIG_11809 [Fasciola gigantica]|uniref:Uncharacterized protein n=1 Tax=Fasciola gigantica TaxID=46835 RepID=A0A504YTP5_FASGI|nr:hypothetical protein FGIG_11809 [Fasciola gigantica]